LARITHWGLLIAYRYAFFRGKVMSNKILTATVMAAGLMVSQVQSASADAFVGGLVGGFLGATLGSQAQRPRGTVRSTGVSSAARQLARDVQTALNHFYFEAGVPDGVLGRQSRAAISQYQAYMTFAVTGELNEFERQVLITAYQRSQLGGAQVIQVTQTHRDGLRGLLPTVRDELLGVTRQPVVEAAAPAPQAPATGLPSFTAGGGAAATVSLASHCNRVALVTSANGGFATPETMTDPVFALNEQFCLARGYAIAEGEALVAQIAGATPDSIAQQCAGLEGVIQPHVAALSSPE
jgi:peptidoglycan hydrolase-like protein with peptidoglycan-binding domain